MDEIIKEPLPLDEEALLCAMGRMMFSHPSSGRRLLESAGSVAALLDGGPALVNCTLGAEDVGEVLFSSQMLSLGKQEALWMRQKGVQLLSCLNDCYPKRLLECPDAPFLLYYRGNFEIGQLQHVHTVSVVGTRMASAYGKESCSEIISEMSRICPDMVIVSGLAIGIDSCAHKAALENGLNTVAILPCGIDRIYPSSNRSLAVRIVAQGGVMTEYPRFTKPLKFNFLQRNRIIAGLSDALLVAESRIRGGSMITVEYSSSYNRDIFAVPGRMTDANSYGCNYLINKNVAQLCLNASTIVSSMGWPSGHISDISKQPSLFSSEDGLKEKLLLSLSSVKGRSTDYLMAQTGESLQVLSLALLELEIEGLVRRDTSDYWFKT